MAAFKVLPVNLDEIDRRLKAARGKAVPEGETAPPPQANPVRHAAPKKKGSVLSRYYDDW